MKEREFKTVTLKLLVLLAGSTGALAIERPNVVDNQPLPAEKVPLTPAQENAPKRDVPLLGVGGDPVHEDLAMHLDIDGGLQLRTVIPQSPAGKSGIQRGDISVSFNGEPIYAQEDLRTAILKHQPGAQVRVGVIQKGALIEKKVTLGRRAAENLGQERLRWGDQSKALPRFDSDQYEELLRRLREKRPDADARGFEPLGNGGTLRLEDILGQLQNNGDIDLEVGVRSSASVTFQDQEGSVELKTSNDDRELIVRDRDGNVLFEGPYNTAKDKSALPEELRERVKQLGVDGEDGRKFQFKIDEGQLILPESE